MDLVTSEYGSFWPEFTTIRMFIALNAITGLISFELAWYKLRRFRKPIHELNAQFPELAKQEAVTWKKWKLYPGALTLFLPRLIVIAIGATLTGFLLNIWLLCHNRERPITGLRKLLCKVTAKLGLNICMIFGWFTWFRH